MLVPLLAVGANAQEPAPIDPASAASPDAGVDMGGEPDAGIPIAPTPVETPPPPPPPPPRGTVGVKGTIVDRETGEPIADATVEVIRGGKGSTTTDADGHYVLDLPPGKYELRISSDLYRGRRVKGVVVKGGLFTVDARLEADPTAIEEVVVVGKPDPRTESAGLEKRKRSAKVEDTISAQEIARSPDSNAGEAVKRVVSATIIDGKYVFIRGLGGRYSMTLLNGVPLPSPDPDNPAVPLDLFPASLLANLTVVKSYTADLPGTFSGGALLIETNTYPEQLEFKLKLAGTYDSASTGKDMLAYDGGSTDYLGFDDGTRALPSIVPTDKPITGQGSMITREQNAAMAKEFDNTWTIYDVTARPNFSLTAQLGDTRKVSGKKIGYLATATYGRKNTVRVFDSAKTHQDNGEFVPDSQAVITRGEDTVSWGGLGNIGLEVDRDHSFGLLTLFSRAADDRALFDTGIGSDQIQYEKTRLQYSVRQLSFTQLSGSHRFRKLGSLELKWQGNLAFTSREEPDTRDIFYTFDPDRYFIETPLSGERQFGDLHDTSGGGGLDLSLPFSRGSFKLGATAQDNTRSSQTRRIGYRSAPGADGNAKTLPADQIFAASRMGVDWLLDERTQADDSYDASRLVTSVFAVGDYKIIEPLRLIVGVRFEHAEQSIAAYSPFDTGAMPAEDENEVDRTDDDWLPGANLVYSLTPRMNLRASYSRTLARPQFRELAPYLYYDFTRRRSITGNPNLVNTSIQNADVRWEYFPAEREVFAASAFYKKFQDPIELVTINPSGDGLFLNSGYPINPDDPVAETDGATVMGIELEARGNFGRLSPALKSFRGAANVTLITSEIDFGTNKGSQTSQKRPLQGQSPYIFNLDLGWQSKDQRFEVSVLYNVFGKRLSEVGISGIPDIYEEPYHRLDFSASTKLPSDLRLKLAGTNLLDQRVEVTQGPVEIQGYDPGLTVGLSLEWAPK